MSTKTGILPLNLPNSVIETILHGNNNFVSTLDHLPCEITRSLWFIQMMNLRNMRNETALKSEYLKPQNERDYKGIQRLKRLTLRNSEELVEESKYLINFLSDHMEILNDDLDIINELETKLPGWTSEAVEERWKKWGEFKLEYFHKVEGKTKNEFEKYIDEFTEKQQPSRPQPSRPRPKSLDLKIKINLKNLSVKTSLKRATSTNASLTKQKKEKKFDVKHEIKPTIKPEPILILKSPVEPEPEFEPEPEPEPAIVKEAEETYCLCNGPSFGKMVACEYNKCPHEWFHFKCVGLTKEPEGVWFCSGTCKEKYEAAQLRKKHRKKRRW